MSARSFARIVEEIPESDSAGVQLRRSLGRPRPCGWVHRFSSTPFCRRTATITSQTFHRTRIAYLDTGDLHAGRLHTPRGQPRSPWRTVQRRCL